MCQHRWLLPLGVLLQATDGVVDDAIAKPYWKIHKATHISCWYSAVKTQKQRDAFRQWCCEGGSETGQAPNGCFDFLFTKRECCEAGRALLVPPLLVQPAVGRVNKRPEILPKWLEAQQAWPELPVEFERGLSQMKCEIPLPGETMPIPLEIWHWKGMAIEMQYVCEELQRDTYGLLEAWSAGKLPKETVLLDVGANVGMLSILMAKLLPESLVVSLEPNPIAMALLHRNIAHAGLQERVLPLHRALANGTASWAFVTGCAALRDFRHWEDAARYVKQLHTVETIFPCNSVAVTSSDSYTSDLLIPVQTTSLKTVVRGIGKRVTVLKLDCEGCETLIGQPQDVYRLAKIVVGEFHGVVKSRHSNFSTLTASGVQLWRRYSQELNREHKDL
eukprot:TRINITY_DN40850_c0_g1_i1.p1 TRINITY_DN40850_c0_g1~~TRINITY_DN40850_c0_g1_i1.p1  ORF type:complete len:390 (-),score=33.87 TRINITY_DN40850_c0_g1_i1:29-1198(-)